MSAEDIARNIDEVRGRIAEAAARSGRRADEITLIGVSKFQPLEAIYAARDHGLAIFGENRVQERAQKSASWTGEDAAWHMIGHLQRNKARRAVGLFSCIQSIDSIELARIVDEAVVGDDRYPVMIEVNTAHEENKSGVEESRAVELAEKVASLDHLKIVGMMTIGPLGGDELAVRSAFASLREIAAKTRSAIGAGELALSMGMSGDYEWAIEEGSTMIRVGTGIFGARSAV